MLLHRVVHNKGKTMKLPRYKDGYIVVVWVALIDWVDKLLPSAEAFQGRVRCITDREVIVCDLQCKQSLLVRIY